MQPVLPLFRHCQLPIMILHLPGRYVQYCHRKEKEKICPESALPRVSPDSPYNHIMDLPYYVFAVSCIRRIKYQTHRLFTVSFVSHDLTEKIL